MININGKLIPQLSDEGFKLISALCDYGKESHPSNEVLLKKCGWEKNIRKLSRAKKELIQKGFVTISDRYKYTEEGRKVRASNKYVINTNLVSKYNGSFQLCNSEQLKNETFKYEQFSFEQLKNDIVQFELCQKSTDNKLLKLISIETIKLLKEDYLLKEKEKKENIKEIEDLKKQIKKLKAKKSSERKKVASKKESPAPDIPPMKDFRPVHSLDIPKELYRQNLQNFQYADHWTEDLIDGFLHYCDGMHTKKPNQWGSAKQLGNVIELIEQNLMKYDMQIVAEALKYAGSKGNAQFNPQWYLNSEENKNKKNSAGSSNENSFFCTT